MEIAEKYVCDADCLINLHRHFGRASLKALRGLGKYKPKTCVNF